MYREGVSLVLGFQTAKDMAHRVSGSCPVSHRLPTLAGEQLCSVVCVRAASTNGLLSNFPPSQQWTDKRDFAQTSQLAQIFYKIYFCPYYVCTVHFGLREFGKGTTYLKVQVVVSVPLF